MSNAQANPKGRLRVDVGTSVAGLIIIPALPAFHARYPDIQIDLGVSDRPVDLISENVDCVVRGGTLTDQSLVARRIGEFHFIACATPEYLKRHGVPTHPSELDHGHTVVRFFSPRTGRAFPFDFAKDGERLEIHGRYIVSVNDSNAYLAAGLAGLGIIQGPTFMVQRHVARGELRAGARRVVVGADAGVCGLPAEPPPQPQGAHLRRLGRRPVREPRSDPEAHDAAQRRAARAQRFARGGAGVAIGRSQRREKGRRCRPLPPCVSIRT